MTSFLKVCYKGLTPYNYTPFIPTCHIGSQARAQRASLVSSLPPPAMWNLMAEEFAQWLLRRGRAAQTVNFALSRQALGEQLLDEYFKSHKASGADGGKRRPTAGDYVCSNSNLERIFLILMLQSLKEPAIQSL